MFCFIGGGEYLDLKKEKLGEKRKLCSEKLNNLHFSRNIVKVIK
jgi:hypothetical protein